MRNRKRIIAVTAVIALLTCAPWSWADNGIWQLGGLSDNWSDTTNWLDGIVADGADFTAYFLVDIPTGGITVNVDAAEGQTIGNLSFGYDIDPETAGGWLVYGNALNMTSFSGTSTLDISDLGNGYSVEISVPISVAAGASLTKTGGGTLMLSGTTTVNDGNTTVADGSTIDVTGALSTLTATPWDPDAPPSTGQTTVSGGSTVSLSGSSALLTSGYNTYMGLDGTDAALNIGLASTDSATVTLNSGLYVGGGSIGSINTATINIHGNSSLTANGGWDEIQIGCWGSGTGVLNVYDTGVVSTPSFRVAHNDLCVGTVNVYNSGQLNATTFYIGDNTDPSVAGSGGTVNLNNQSQLNATGNVYVGSNGNGALNINDDSTATISGALITSAWGYWAQDEEGTWYCSAANSGTVTISGSNRLALQAGWISTGDGSSIWPSSGTCTGTITVTENARISTTGDCIIGQGSAFVGTLNLDTSAQATIGGQLIIGQMDGSQGYVNVSDNAQLTAAGIQVSSGDGWYIGWQVRQLNISDDALVSSTGDTSVGAAANTGGFVTITGNGQLTVSGNLIMGSSGPAWQNSITNSGSKSTLVAGDLNLNAGSIYLPGITSDGTGVAGGLDVLGTVKLNGGWLVATAPNSDFIKPTILVQAGGAKIDPQWNNLTITQALAEDSTSMGGGLEIGQGNVILTGALTYTGATLIDDQWSTLEIDSPGTTDLAAISGAGALKIGDGVVANTVSADSVSVGKLTIAAGSKLTINPLFGGPPPSGLTAVPEPSTLVLLAMSALALLGFVWKQRR
jgi:fibronectin-binding autotransporter adhesin